MRVDLRRVAFLAIVREVNPVIAIAIAIAVAVVEAARREEPLA